MNWVDAGKTGSDPGSVHVTLTASRAMAERLFAARRSRSLRSTPRPRADGARPRGFALEPAPVDPLRIGVGGFPEPRSDRPMPGFDPASLASMSC